MSHDPENLIPVIPIAPTMPGDGKIHVRLVEGFYQNIRRLISWPLLLAFFVFAWIEIDNQPLLMFDLAARRIFFFGQTLSWHDLPILAGLLICGASLLFFMAVGWGRVWCGFACPQSIWTWIFIRLEQWTEGRASKRAREEGNLSGTGLLRRGLKHLSWLLVAFITAFTFTAYFTPAEQLAQQVITLQTSAFTTTWLLCMSLLTYINAGLVREKVCLHMCPYSRFQGVMFDRDTRTVSYDVERGEPRSQLGKAAQLPTGKTGDCVDCGICVQVCPTGIDIRQGLQAACIDCAACIDACDQVMLKLNRKPGLIGFYSEQQLSGSANNLDNSPFLRSRLLCYLSVVVISLWSVTYAFNHRDDLILEVQRERGALFQQQDEQICNHYQLKGEFLNNTTDPAAVSVSGLNSLPAPTLRLHGPEQLSPTDQGYWSRYRVCADPEQLQPRQMIRFMLKQGENIAIQETTFLAPAD